MKRNLRLRALPPPEVQTGAACEGFTITDDGALEVELERGGSVAVVISPRGALVQQRSTTSPSSSCGGNSPCGGAEGGEGGLDSPGRLLLEDLELGAVIGRGSQAVVRRALHRPSQRVYAVKCIDLHAPLLDPTDGRGAGGGRDGCEEGSPRVSLHTLQRELSRLSAAAHANIVAYKEAFFVDRRLMIVMEYMNLGSLSSVLRATGALPVGVLCGVTAQVVAGLAALHSSAIVHRDLKPSNLLVNRRGVVKITDFGVSAMLTEKPHQQGHLSHTGSTAYMSPERIRGNPHGPPCDIWALGVTCAECALGVYPFFPEGLSEDCEENPFAHPPNLFDLSTLIAEDRAVVEWQALVPLLTRFPPHPRGAPPAGIPEVCQAFVS
eukprot:RCo053028